MTFTFPPGHWHPPTRDVFVPPFRCERELAGVMQISQEILDSSENGVQWRGFSRWPLSAFCVLQTQEGHVNGQEIVCVCVCGRGGGGYSLACVPHFSSGCCVGEGWDAADVSSPGDLNLTTPPPSLMCHRSEFSTIMWTANLFRAGSGLYPHVSHVGLNSFSSQKSMPPWRPSWSAFANCTPAGASGDASQQQAKKTVRF